MTLGERIIMYRAKHRITQREFAEKAGISVQTVYLIESEQQNPKKITVAKIELALEENEEEKEC